MALDIAKRRNYRNCIKLLEEDMYVHFVIFIILYMSTIFIHII